MNVSVTVRDVQTHLRAVDNKYPIVDFVLDFHREGDRDPTELRFTELLSNIEHLTDEELDKWLKAVAKDYVKVAYGGIDSVDSKSGKWVKEDTLRWKSFNIAINDTKPIEGIK